MGSTETILLVSPNGKYRALKSLPASRDDAICIVRAACTGSGKYTFVRRVADPDCEEIEFAEITVFSYTNGEFGITGSAPASAIEATSNDIAIYFREVTGFTGNRAIRISLDVYDDTSASERNIVWLRLEELENNSVAEFALEIRERLALSYESESSTKAIFVCKIPSLRSVFRIVSIACELFHSENIQIRSFPINSRSADWFS